MELASLLEGGILGVLGGSLLLTLVSGLVAFPRALAARRARRLAERARIEESGASAELSAAASAVPAAPSQPISEPARRPSATLVVEPVPSPTPALPAAEPVVEATPAVPVAEPVVEPTPAVPVAEPVVEATPAVPVAEPVVEPTPAPEPAPEPPAAPRRTLREGLARTRAAFVGRLETLLGGAKELDAATFDEIEALLFAADLGVRTADGMLGAVRNLESPDAVRPALEARALEILGAVARPRPDRAHDGPHVVLVVGVNGSGKTTTVGKLAARWKAEGQSVVVAAGDTFRAAAVEQLEIWCERAGVQIVKGKAKGDPAAVAFDGLKTALDGRADTLLIDTAGRLQTDRGLMDELAKIGRVLKRDLPDAPHEVLLVLDAHTGQNAIRQAQEFSRAVEVSGIVLTKLDGTAKGGVVLGVAEEVGLPVWYVGIGEGVDDLRDFAPEEFVQALLRPDSDADSDAGS